MIVILFGLSGSGKNFVGTILQEEYDIFFWDADELLSDEMRLFIEERRPFTQKMRDAYYQLVLQKIKTLHEEHPHIAVSQAFYKDKNRKEILQELPDCLFLKIQADSVVLEQRLRARRSEVDVDYARLISMHYEEPTHDYVTINNNCGAAEIREQLSDISDLEPITHQKNMSSGFSLIR